ncbi:hypothetical protein Tco_0929601 [Tanacetum coccineum]
MMRNLVKNQWCAAHNGTITMKDIKAMHKKQLVEEYEYNCRRLEKDRLLSAQYSLFRPKPAITEPPSKRQRVKRASLQPDSVPTATTHTADDPDSAGGGSSNPAGGIMTFPYKVMRTSRDWVCSRVAVDLTRDDEVLAEILFRGERRTKVLSLTQVESDVGLDLWRDVNLLCQSLHSDDVEDFWRTQDEWIVSSWIATVQAGLRESYECLASAPIAVDGIVAAKTEVAVLLMLCCFVACCSKLHSRYDYISAGHCSRFCLTEIESAVVFYRISTGNTKVNTANTEISTASFSDATVYAFLSTQPQGECRDIPRSYDKLIGIKVAHLGRVSIEDASEKAMCCYSWCDMIGVAWLRKNSKQTWISGILSF